MDTGSEHKVKGLIEDLSISKNAEGNYDVVFQIAGTEIRGTIHAASLLEATITSDYAQTYMWKTYLSGVKLHMELAGDLIPAGDAVAQYQSGDSAPVEGDYWTMTRKGRDGSA
jgi:hypothetical protein